MHASCQGYKSAREEICFYCTNQWPAEQLNYVKIALKSHELMCEVLPDKVLCSFVVKGQLSYLTNKKKLILKGWHHEGIFSPDLSVVECEGDNVVKHEVRVLQVNLASSLNNDEVLDWWKPFSVRQLHTESQGVWLRTSSNDEVLKYTSSIKTDWLTVWRRPILSIQSLIDCCHHILIHFIVVLFNQANLFNLPEHPNIIENTHQSD